LVNFPQGKRAFHLVLMCANDKVSLMTNKNSQTKSFEK